MKKPIDFTNAPTVFASNIKILFIFGLLILMAPIKKVSADQFQELTPRDDNKSLAAVYATGAAGMTALALDVESKNRARLAKNFKANAIKHFDGWNKVIDSEPRSPESRTMMENMGDAHYKVEYTRALRTEKMGLRLKKYSGRMGILTIVAAGLDLAIVAPAKISSLMHKFVPGNSSVTSDKPASGRVTQLAP